MRMSQHVVKKSIALVLTAGLVMLSLAGCGKTNDQSQKKLYSIGTATQAGSNYQMGSAIATVLNKYIPEAQFSAQATAGGTQNIELMRQQKVDMEIGFDFQASDAYQAVEQYQGKPKADFLRDLVYVGTWTSHTVVGKNSGINDVTDFTKKKISVGSAGSGVEFANRRILSVLGIDFADNKYFTASHMSISDGGDAITNNQADGLMDTQVSPASAVTNIMATGKAKMIGFSDSEISKLTEIPEFKAITIPTGTYPNQDTDIKTISIANHLIVSNSFPADLAYKVTKVLIEHRDELQSMNAIFKTFDSKTAMQKMTVPIADGAMKYFKEVGIAK